jgi:CsbD-like.
LRATGSNSRARPRTWGKLTDDDLDVIAGKRDQLAGRVQEAYGVSKDEAEKQIRDWEDRNKDLRQ